MELGASRKTGIGLAGLALLLWPRWAGAQPAPMPMPMPVAQAMIQSGVETAWRDRHDTASVTRALDLCADQLHRPASMRRNAGLRRCLAYETAVDQVAARLGGPATAQTHATTTTLVEAGLTQLGIAPAARPELEADMAARSRAALDTIVAVEAAPRRRYATANGLQDITLATLPEGRAHAMLDTAAAQCGGGASGFLDQAGGGLRMTRTDAGAACRLDIAPRDGGLVVTEQDCSALHGAGCDFAGSYRPAP